MIRRFMAHMRRHFVAYTALFIVLGGSAVALPGKKSVDKNDLKKNVVKTKNIKNKAVTRAKLANNAIGPGQAGGLVEGNGQLLTRSFTSNRVGFLPEPQILANIPGMGQIRFLFCGNGADDQMRVQILSAEDSQPFLGVGSVNASGIPLGVGGPPVSDVGGGPLSAGGGEPYLTQVPAGDAGLGVAAKWDFQLSRGSGANAVGAHVSVSGVNTDILGPPGCSVTAQTIIQR